MAREWLSECPCGSRREAWILRDARGIECGYVCEDCEEETRKKYKPEVFENPHYYFGERIEPDDPW